MRCWADGVEGFLSSSAIGISPEVGVFDAEDSFDGEPMLSPRSRDWVDGDSCGARCDLRLWRSII